MKQFSQGADLYCTKAISGKGIEVGDRCVKLADAIYPYLRWYPESCISDEHRKPFHLIHLDDLQDFEFEQINAAT